jgi:hypothetical protein
MKKVADKEPSEKKEDNILAEPTRKTAGGNETKAE